MSTLAAPERRAEGGFDLPVLLGGLVPGRYLIEIEAVSGADASRLIWGFTIKG
jgi:hypothetical protein